jgi:hypothetical protein
MKGKVLKMSENEGKLKGKGLKMKGKVLHSL